MYKRQSHGLIHPLCQQCLFYLRRKCLVELCLKFRIEFAVKFLLELAVEFVLELVLKFTVKLLIQLTLCLVRVILLYIRFLSRGNRGEQCLIRFLIQFKMSVLQLIFRDSLICSLHPALVGNLHSRSKADCQNEEQAHEQIFSPVSRCV